MPYQDMPWIRQNRLQRPGQPSLRVDSQAWFAWLERITAFCYQPPGTADRFTLRKEKRRQQCYWYAYLKKNRKLHNAYAGKTETLTARRLQQVCATLLVKAARQRQGVGNG
ncbi:MAG: hypothetical protein IPM53_25415 [Anaerolineaceae bacterium]|nr:hypothetical protein [Anaerolineaceae bacterium]